MDAILDPLSITFAALSDPTRRAILQKLAAGAATVTELSKPFAMSLPAITKHLKVLEKAGLITKSRDAQFRPCQMNALPLKEAVKWMEQYSKFWEESLDRLEIYMNELEKKEKKDDPSK